MTKQEGLLSLCVLVLSVGCGGGDGDACLDGGGHEEHDAGHEEHDAGTGHVERHDYDIFFEAGHAHARREIAMTFTVRDMEACTDPMDPLTCPGVAGLPVVATRRHIDASSTRTQELDPGVLDDTGDGTYTWIRSFNDIGAYALGLEFETGEQHYAGAFPYEVSKAGGERIFCPDATAPTHSFQVRWSNEPGHIHADGTTMITFDFELLRSFGTVNTDMPWTNSFDHLTPDDFDGGTLPTFELLDSAGAVFDTLTPTYRGRGIYRVERVFVDGEGDADYDFRVSFTDTNLCAVSETGEDYAFDVRPVH